jgi:crotonobetainyl-CoA hydratase
MSNLVLVERRNRAAIVTINRPDVRNCIDSATAMRLRQAFDALESDDAVDAVIVTGAGEKAFCSGLDLKELARRGPSLIPEVIFEDVGWAGIGKRRYQKPLIAAVNGAAIAGGVELVLSCDFAFAAEHAVFAFNEATLGPIADAGGCFRLPFAREMLLTGRFVSAEEARSAGLVNRVVPAATLMDACLDAVERISHNSPSAMRIMKQLIAETHDRPEDEAWIINDRYMAASFETPDFMEGPKAFTEKRNKTFSRRA